MACCGCRSGNRSIRTSCAGSRRRSAETWRSRRPHRSAWPRCTPILPGNSASAGYRCRLRFTARISWRSEPLRLPDSGACTVDRAGRVDGQLVDGPGWLLAATAADCVPVYLWSRARGRVGLIHAGWRGAAAGILPRAISRLVRGPRSPHRRALSGISASTWGPRSVGAVTRSTRLCCPLSASAARARGSI